MTKVTKCMICKEEFDGKGANEHRLKTGHNKWLLIKDKKRGDR